MIRYSLLALCTGVALPSFSPLVQSADKPFDGPSPWMDIRQQRMQTLLPSAMSRAKVSHWLIVCRENDNDPIAAHVGCENAGGTAVVVFSKQAERVNSRMFSPVSESTAVKELGIFDEVIDVERTDSAIEVAADWLNQQEVSALAINSFSGNPQADGLSHSQYLALKETLAPKMATRLTAAEPVIYEWLSRKLPSEVDIMAKAATITSNWQYEAYQTVIPGKTTDKDIADFLKKRIADAGVQDGWAPDQNPAVNSGPDRGHSHPTDRIIQPGDVIQIDFGIRVFDRWVTDIQRFAYVLKPGETKAPANIQHAWDSAIAGSRAAFEAMQPGVTGNHVHEAQRVVMEREGSLPVMWSTGHPVGYVAHDTGPNLGVRSTSSKYLDDGMTFAFDGFYSWYYPGSNEQQTKTISVEEMVVITEDGARYLTPPQSELILISTEE
ncbi:M24 family metallopeptidase [Alteromonas sp. H39]|uniref:M24 family metallopeptidase n=1 Tax=Alteromonas sp. H39 TaxID=3389876 RepID=UPI0039DF9FB0